MALAENFSSLMAIKQVRHWLVLTKGSAEATHALSGERV
jgi:hypothetical protein